MGLDAQDKLTLERFESATKGIDVRSAKLRSMALDLARQIIESCPDCAERSGALTHLDSALLFANAAAVRYPVE
jgi:hypothetical protein